MTRLRLIFVASAVLACCMVPVPSTAAPAGATTNAELLKRSCFGCHNGRLKTGGLALDNVDAQNLAANAEIWEKVLRKLQLGVMPPLNVRRPDDASYATLIQWLEDGLDHAATLKPNPGHPLLHRLNRAEYANAIRDLLGLYVDVSALLPPDDSAFGFDNVADVLNTSPALLQAYLAAARKISAVAVGDPRVSPGSDTYTVPQDLSQDEHLEGLPLGTIGGLLAQHTFPVDGEYEFQVKLYRTNLNAMRGLQAPHQLELALDGSRILMTSVGGNDDLVAVQKNPTAASDDIESQRLRIRVAVKAGRHQIESAFLGETSPRFETNRLQRFVRDFNPYDAEGAPHVKSVTIKGPFNASKTWRPLSAALSTCRPSSAADEQTCARRILTTIARHAYRRPLSPDESRRVMAFYEQGRAGTSSRPEWSSRCSSFWRARRSCFAPKTRPSRSRRERRTASPTTSWPRGCRSSCGAAFRTTNCCNLAADGTAAPTGRARAAGAPHAGRLAGPTRSSTTSPGSGCSCATCKRIVPNSGHRFRISTTTCARRFARETELFFGSIIHEDRNVARFADGRLHVRQRAARAALRHPERLGSHFRRVHAATIARRGLLGKGAILLVTSHANDDVAGAARQVDSRELLGAPPPPPPPDVPALKENEPGATTAHDARADGAAPRESRSAPVPQDDGSDRVRARELRRRRRVAYDERDGAVAAEYGRRARSTAHKIDGARRRCRALLSSEPESSCRR